MCKQTLALNNQQKLPLNPTNQPDIVNISMFIIYPHTDIMHVRF